MPFTPLLPLGLSSFSRGRLYAPLAVTPLLVLAAFGPQIKEISGTSAGTSAAAVFLRQDVWQVSSGIYTLSVAERSTVIATNTDADVGIRLELKQVQDNVMAMVRASADGRSGYEVGIINVAGVPRARIRRVLEGQLIDEGAGAFYVTNNASGIPASAACDVDVSTRINLSQSYTIEARIAGDLVELRINDETVPTLRHIAPPSGTAYAPIDTSTFAPSWAGAFPSQTGIGFVSSASGAVVRSAQRIALVGQTTSRTDLLVAVAGGNVYLVSPDQSVRTVGTGVFPPSVPVEVTEYFGKVYMVGGGRARVLDPIRQVVSFYTPTQGTLIGQTTAGTTSFDIVDQFGTRLAFAGADTDPQNALYSAVGDANDVDTGSDLPGKAFLLSASRPLKTGQPITGMHQHTNGSQIVGCERSIHLVQGDPVLGQFDTLTLLDDAGMNGARAAVRVEDGRVLISSPQGLILVAGTSAINLSRSVLSVGIQTNTLVNAIMARDPSRHLTWVVLPDSIWAYDERLGGFAPGTGGFHPQKFPTAMQPTSAATWLGRMIFGCADGYIRFLDDNANTDDGEAINSYLTVTTGGDGITGELIVSGVKLNLTARSGLTRVTLYGAKTVEDVIDEKKRRPLMGMVVGPFRSDRHAGSVRAQAISVVVGPTTDGKPWALEVIDAKVSQGSTQTGVGS